MWLYFFLAYMRTYHRSHWINKVIDLHGDEDIKLPKIERLSSEHIDREAKDTIIQWQSSNGKEMLPRTLYQSPKAILEKVNKKTWAHVQPCITVYVLPTNPDMRKWL